MILFTWDMYKIMDLQYASLDSTYGNNTWPPVHCFMHYIIQMYIIYDNNILLYCLWIECINNFLVSLRPPFKLILVDNPFLVFLVLLLDFDNS